jgi:hypothetical protein
MCFRIVDGDHDAILFDLGVVAAVFDGFVPGVVGGHLGCGKAERMRRSSKCFVRAEEEVALEGLLSVCRQARWRRDVGRLDFGKGLRKRIEVVRGEESVNGVGPRGGVREEVVPVVSVRRGEDELIVAALGSESGVELLRELGPEELVVLGVDPQHRHAGVFAEFLVSVDKVIGIADVVIGL